MTLVPKTRSKLSLRRGMSLLEVVVVLSLIALLLTIGLVAYNGQANDRNLRLTATEIEAMAGRARSLAFLKQIPHRLALTGSAELQLQKATAERGYLGIDTFTGEGVRISFRRWGAKDDEWLDYAEPSQESGPVIWSFSPTGLCEPVSIRIMEGGNWIVLHMDALTGMVQEEESFIE